MATVQWIFLVLVATAGQCQSRVISLEAMDDLQLLKSMYVQVQRQNEPPLLLQQVETEERCYPEIGCFSPTTGIVNDLKLYPDPPQVLDTKFRLYTRKNREVAEIVDYIDRTTLDTQLFNPNAKVVFIIHGMNEHGQLSWIIDMKNDLLSKEDVNVITVDWGNGAPLPYYAQGVVNAELISRQTSRLLTHLKAIRGYDIRKTHFIGYSLGAHLSGFTAKYLKQEGEIVGRITGLDPAGPLFEDKNENYHLSSKDADFVDVIHTSAGNNILFGEVGIIKPIGHLDFYPNGGKEQPGCGFLSLVCSHKRSLLLFTESILSDCQFESFQCNSYADFKEGKCTSEKRQNLGYITNDASQQGSFFLTTNSASPYCIKEHFA